MHAIINTFESGCGDYIIYDFLYCTSEQIVQIDTYLIGAT